MAAPVDLKFLIVYGTTEGQTRRIASWVGHRLRASGHEVSIHDSTAPGEAPDMARYDGVLVMGSVHQGHYQASLIDFIRSHREALRQRPAALLSVSLSAVLEHNRDEATRYSEALAHTTGWQPSAVEHVAGALRYTQYDFFKRQIMKFIVSSEGGPADTGQDYEFTDWTALGRFVDRFSEGIRASKGSIATGADGT